MKTKSNPLYLFIISMVLFLPLKSSGEEAPALDETMKWLKKAVEAQAGYNAWYNGYKYRLDVRYEFDYSLKDDNKVTIKKFEKRFAYTRAEEREEILKSMHTFELADLLQKRHNYKGFSRHKGDADRGADIVGLIFGTRDQALLISYTNQEGKKSRSEVVSIEFDKEKAGLAMRVVKAMNHAIGLSIKKEPF